MFHFRKPRKGWARKSLSSDTMTVDVPARARRRPVTAQRKRTLAREQELRTWYWGAVSRYIEWRRQVGSWVLPDPRYCGRCGRMHGIDVDHTTGRQGGLKWDGRTLQSLCAFCNRILKGSRKGREWDFRTEDFRAFLVRDWNRHWSWNEVTRRWEKINGRVDDPAKEER